MPHQNLKEKKVYPPLIKTPYSMKKQNNSMNLHVASLYLFFGATVYSIQFIYQCAASPQLFL